MKPISLRVVPPARPLPPLLILHIVLWGRPAPQPGDRPVRCLALVYTRQQIVLLLTGTQALAPSYLVEARIGLLNSLPFSAKRLLIIDCQRSLHSPPLAEVSGERQVDGRQQLVQGYVSCRQFRDLYMALMRSVIISPQIPYQAYFSDN